MIKTLIIVAATLVAAAAHANVSVSMRVQPEEGDELAVLGMLIEASASGETWTISDWISSGTAVAAQILSRYPHSAYAPYATLVHATQTQQERLDAIDLALAQRPPGPVADLLLAVKGSVHAFLSNKAFGKGDLDRATAEARAAQTVLRDLIRTTPYGFVRDEANATLNQVKDPEDVRNLFDAIRECGIQKRIRRGCLAHRRRNHRS